MTKRKDKPRGLLKDPWRQKPPPAVEKPTPRRVPKQKASRSAAGLEELHDDLQDPKYSTIELKGYGGITVEGTDDTSMAAAQVLTFCVDNYDKVSDKLLEYGILLTQLESSDNTISFYIKRKDGWLLAVPEVSTRDAGCFQLIQAMLDLYTDKETREIMQKYKIRPFKM